MTIAAGSAATAADQLQLHNADGTLKSSIVAFSNLAAAVALALNRLCQGRLTLTSGTPVTTANVTGATSIYFTPYQGSSIALYNGTTWDIVSFTETTLSLGTLTSGLPYDVFGYSNAGTLSLEALAWSSGTARATALVMQDGVLCKTGALTRRYLGTFYTTSTTQTEDSTSRRLLWNYYNRARRTLVCSDATNSWSYNGVWRSANGSTTDGTGRVACVVGVAEDAAKFEATSIWVTNTTQARGHGAGVGIDSTSVNSAQIYGSQSISTLSSLAVAKYRGYLAVGYHFIQRLESDTGSGSGGTTFYGVDAGAVLTGMVGEVMG